MPAGSKDGNSNSTSLEAIKKSSRSPDMEPKKDGKTVCSESAMVWKLFSNLNYKVSNVLTILYISKVQKRFWWIKFIVQLLWSATMEVWIKGKSCDMFILTAFVCLVVIIVPHLWKSTHALIKAKNNQTYKSLLLLKGWALL